MAFDPLSIVQHLSEGWDHFLTTHSDIGYDWLDNQVDIAVIEYSLERPVLRTEQVTSTSTTTAPVPSNWEAEFSKVKSIEYPVGQSPRKIVDSRRYQVVHSTSGWIIEFINSLIDENANLNVTYNGLHTWKGASATLAAPDYVPVRYLAASIAARAIAGFYSDMPTPAFENKAPEADSLASRWRTLSKSLREDYEKITQRRKSSVELMTVRK